MNPMKNDPTIQPGGYHSEGQPGEEGDVRKQMRVYKVTDSNRVVNRSMPLKGGGDARSTSAGRLDSAAELEGKRAVYVLTRKDADHIESPVLNAGEQDEESAVLLFSDREKALLYMQVAGWDDYMPISLSPPDLRAWLSEARGDGIELAAVDPDRQDHLQGTPQPVLVLGEMVDESEDTLYREVLDLASGR